MTTSNRGGMTRKRRALVPVALAMLTGLPLMLGGGTGAELRQPLGVAMVGGLLVSQALTLFTTPVVYLYLDRLNTWQQRKKAAPAVSAG